MLVCIRLGLFLALIVATHTMYTHILCILKVQVTVATFIVRIKTTAQQNGDIQKQSIISWAIQLHDGKFKLFIYGWPHYTT